MDVKNSLSSILPSHLQAKDPVDRAIKSGSATDRDGNGQMPFDEKKKQKQPMTDGEFEKALEQLKNLDVVRTSQWVVEAASTESQKIVLLKDASGKVLRRILEEELWQLLEAPDKHRGQLLNKAA